MPTGAPDYFKRILLYGVYEGAAVPLACDEQGRLIFIPEQVSPFDKSGTILLRDDFADGLIHLESACTGDGCSVALLNTEALIGGYSCKLTGGSDGTGRAQVTYYILPSMFNKLGVEWGYRPYLIIGDFEVWRTVYTSTRRLIAKLKLDWNTQKWQIYNGSTSAWVDVVTSVNYTPHTALFYKFKLVVDTATEMYHSLRHPGGFEDISAYSLDSSDSAERAHVQTLFRLTSREYMNDWVLLDNIIFTQDES